MKNVYNLSLGQFLTFLLFSIIVWINVIKNACEWYKYCNRFDSFYKPTLVADWLGFIIPFLVIFYTLGWLRNRKNNENS